MKTHLAPLDTLFPDFASFAAVKEIQPDDIITLAAEDGTLGIAIEADDELDKFWPLVHYYPSGDIDTISDTNPRLDHLRGCLIDSIETGIIRSNYKAARLPDGSILAL